MPIGLGLAIGSTATRDGITASTTYKPTYYVDTGGSDGADGLTPATAWQTITKVNAQSFTAGQIVAFRGGQTFSGAIVAPSSGSAGSPIVFTSYGAGRATISSGTSRGFSATNLSYITVEGLNFTGNGTTNVTSGIFCTNTQAGNTHLAGLRIANCDVTGYGINGIHVYGEHVSGSGFASPVISGCRAFSNAFGVRDATGGTCGIKINSMAAYYLGWTAPAHTSPRIENCVANNNTGIAASSDWTGSGIVMAECLNGVITGCTAYTNGAAGTTSAGSVGIWMYDCDACIIQYCTAYDNRTANGSSDGGGFDIDGGCRACIVQFCLSYANNGPGYAVFSFLDAPMPASINSVIRYNISINDGAANSAQPYGIKIDSSITGQTGIQIYNNTVYTNRSGNACIAILFTGTYDYKISNNVFYTGDAGARCIVTSGDPSSSLFQGNDYFGIGTVPVRWNSVSYATVALWQAAKTTQEKVGALSVALISDPQLFNAGGLIATDYKLKSRSPMIGAGLNLNTLNGWTLPALDYFGNPVPNPTGYNVGAHGALA